MHLAVLIEHDPETKTYGATSPDLPDVVAVGESRDDVLARFASAATEYLAYRRETSGAMPEPRFEAVEITITDAAYR